jgi:signal transduction histidine kinase
MPELDPKPIKLLLIEDDEDDSILIQGLLSEVGPTAYEITWIKTYEAALTELTERNHDVCLLDYRLGNRSGLDVLQDVGACCDKPPIIILTGHGDYDVDKEMMRHGAADYLVKGQIDSHILERSIRYAIERKKSENVIRDSEKQLQYLSDQLLAVQENERRKLAAEFHDNLGQLLTAIKFSVENVITQMPPRVPLACELQALIPMIQEAVEHVRNIYTQMRPALLDDLGILATINWFCREFANTNQRIVVEKEITVSEEEIPGNLKLVIFRIVQEAMGNIASHSGANHVWLKLSKKEDNLLLKIRDDGNGFDMMETASRPRDENGLGLVIMKRRAELLGGILSIESEIGGGTTVRILWPLPEGD